jgi:hypothetical protein
VSYFLPAVEIAVLTRVNGKTCVGTLPQKELLELIAEHEKLEKEEELRKKKEAEART